jgi:hypothetical protein
VRQPLPYEPPAKAGLGSDAGALHEPSPSSHGTVITATVT